MRKLATVVLVFSLGCADDQLPVQPTPAIPTAEWGGPTSEEFSASGSVSDTAGRPLSGASVAVTAGPGAGTATMTDERGRFGLPGIFTSAITVRVSKEGYLPEATTFPPQVPSSSLRPLAPGEVRHWYRSLHIQPDGPSTDMTGVYTLTLTAHSSCTSLPVEARARTYTATIAPGPRPNTFAGSLTGARIAPVPAWGPYFEIAVAGEFANVSLSFVEQLDDTTYLAIEGGAAASVGPEGMTAPFNAHFLRCRNQPAWNGGEFWSCSADVQGGECATNNNQLSLVRR